jgi:HPt (histidine-containing phosphotransfer) domain-containing protein
MVDEGRGNSGNVATAPTPVGRRTALDRELALSRVGGDLELLQEIALLFLSDSERMLSEIEKAVSARDAKALDRAAHTLKGCVSNFGAQHLYEVSLALERMGRSGDLTNMESAFQLLKAEIGQLERDLHVLTA